MRKLGPADYRVMPWKNGGGSTTELLIHPPGATLEEGFQWRLSMADVTASGPFSNFPGVDRTLMLLAGYGMDLDHGDHGHQRLEGPFRPVTFSGDWPTSGTLLDGPCRDFNVMSARGVVRHALDVLSLDEPIDLPEADLVLVFCLRGQAEVQGTPLAEGELLVLEGGARAKAFAPGGAEVAVVTLHTADDPSLPR